jgi:four helix bundle protein
MAGRFEDLEVWRKARILVAEVYRRTGQGRFSHDFGLREQIRRAAVSVGSNIAEGYERGGNREFLQFVSHAKGSCGEVRAQLHIAHDQGYLGQADYEDLVERATEISRMLAGLIRHLRGSELRGAKYR